MTRNMLIDAVHPEDVRVVVVDKNRLEEFDFDTAAKKQIKGNIYLAKVTRVEPSLQAAFVEYGGNKQGFLPFSEIHSNYYHIPTEDKEKLLEEAAATAPPEEEEDEDITESDDIEKDEDGNIDDSEENDKTPAKGELSSEDGADPLKKRPNFYRRYKIQEVIKRNQILLVQIIKEERGNKGASLTTYISLPGRYCVLMPNSLKTGGVSRRINKVDDRKRLKKIVSELELDDGMSIIIRTAGIDRSKIEIKRDCSYLVKLWNTIREEAVSMTAPALVNEEGDIIKRALRDIYDSAIEEIIVEGEEAFKTTKNLMKIMVPSHVKKVKQHSDNTPLFRQYKVDQELDQLHSNTANLKSGGSIVINPTEALVSIDVNSGKSTGERNIEGTALKTNLEAAEEVARQLRLRDLAGLVVVDFIDMLEFRNKRTIERALKDALRSDRAKIQVGRISNFGLLEMSRQRLRSSLMESNSSQCPMCKGSGMVRSKESVAMMHMRALEHEAAKRRSNIVTLRTSMDSAHYLLNHRRVQLLQIEEETGANISILGDSTLIGEDYFIDKPGRNNSTRGGDNSPRKRTRNNNRPANKNTHADRSPQNNHKGKNKEQPVQKPNNNKPHHKEKVVAKEAEPSAANNTTEKKTQESLPPIKHNDKPFPVTKEPAREFALAGTKSSNEKSVLKGLWKKITD